MDDDRALKAWFESVLVPCEVFIIHIVRFEHLLRKFLLFLLLVMHFSLLLCRTFCLVLKIESNWLLEVTLHSAALMLSPQSIEDLNIDFRSIESSISMVKGPRSSKFVECFFQSSFSSIPLFIGSKTFLGSGGKLKFESEAKDLVDVVQEIKAAHNFVR